MTVLAQQLAVCLWNTGKAAAVTTAKSPLEAPLRGWSTWNSFQCHINATVINESIAALAASPLFKAGYNYVLIDDCWTVCDEPSTDGSGMCKIAGPRDNSGRIQASSLNHLRIVVFNIYFLLTKSRQTL